MQLGNSLLFSKTFRSLSSGAKHLYICMSMESGGRGEFAFPKAASEKYGLAYTSFVRYKQELEKLGFIECVEHNGNLRKANKYRFCYSWK